MISNRDRAVEETNVRFVANGPDDFDPVFIEKPIIGSHPLAREFRKIMKDLGISTYKRDNTF